MSKEQQILHHLAEGKSQRMIAGRVDYMKRMFNRKENGLNRRLRKATAAFNRIIRLHKQ